MTTNETSNEDNHEVVVLDGTPVPVEPGGPPASMTPAEVEQAQAQARDLVNSLRDSAGGRQLAVVDEITSTGVQAQRNAGRQLELAKTRLGTFLSEGGASKEIATGMVDLRVALNRIDPNLSRRGLWARTVGAIPFLGGNNAVVRALQKIALRFEPVSKQVTVIETRLREGRALLARDNIELRKLYEDVEGQQELIQRAAYLGELLIDELTTLLAETTDRRERDRVQGALHDVSMRVVDLRSMEEVHVQYFVSIELTRQNNNRLGQAVDRTVTLATNVVTVGLAIQAALIRQKRVMEATERTRKFIGDLIAANAASIKQHTEQIGDLYNQPVVAMDMLVQAHNNLLSALDTASHLREDGIAAARRNVEELKTLTAGLADRVEGLADEDDRQPAR
jgi:uncharacterized protein YaaN involved in tellurite resistance